MGCPHVADPFGDNTLYPTKCDFRTFINDRWWCDDRRPWAWANIRAYFHSRWTDHDWSSIIYYFDHLVLFCTHSGQKVYTNRWRSMFLELYRTLDIVGMIWSSKVTAALHTPHDGEWVPVDRRHLLCSGWGTNNYTACMYRLCLLAM